MPNGPCGGEMMSGTSSLANGITVGHSGNGLVRRDAFPLVCIQDSQGTFKISNPPTSAAASILMPVESACNGPVIILLKCL